MAKLFVTYPAGEGAHFDRDYYVGRHLPLVEKEWGPSGLQTAQAFFPAGAGGPDIAVAVLTFATDEAIGVALASPATAAVLGDLANFTNISPNLARGVAP